MNKKLGAPVPMYWNELEEGVLYHSSRFDTNTTITSWTVLHNTLVFSGEGKGNYAYYWRLPANTPPPRIAKTRRILIDLLRAGGMDVADRLRKL